jgi:hypothetical protein
MKSLRFIIIICVSVFFAGQRGFAQSNTQQIDSMKLKVRTRNSEGNGTGQNAQGYGSNQAGNMLGNQTAKRVRSGRPDMTRVRGARPPSIVRPSGSGIPKGVGKPGGVGRKGGR